MNLLKLLYYRGDTNHKVHVHVRTVHVHVVSYEVQCSRTFSNHCTIEVTLTIRMRLPPSKFQIILVYLVRLDHRPAVLFLYTAATWCRCQQKVPVSFLFIERSMDHSVLFNSCITIVCSISFFCVLLCFFPTCSACFMLQCNQCVFILELTDHLAINYEFE